MKRKGRLDKDSYYETGGISICIAFPETNSLGKMVFASVVFPRIQDEACDKRQITDHARGRQEKRGLAL